ncbi:MAG: M28 family peptidase [Ignavibacteriae bacterium]|nr:M28 family peptidase [Ignavibacteriota bacterium]
MMKRFFFSLLLSVSLAIAVASAQPKSNPQVTAKELAAHVKYLASDELEGRRSGTRGAERAAQYVADSFKSYGLKPAGENGTYFQPFDFIAGAELGKHNKLMVQNSELKLEQDFAPLGQSSSATYSGEVVFVGYGISSPTNKYDEYEGINAAGKAVLVLRGTLDQSNPHSELAGFTSLDYKINKAKEKGAAAVLIVSGPVDDEPDNFVAFRYNRRGMNSGIPVVNITKRSADILVSPTGKALRELQVAIQNAKAPQSILLPKTSIDLTTDIKEINAKDRNVVAFLEGNDPQLKNEIIVVGAHLDHLGFGGEGSLSPDTVAIHNGADDNASGTSGLLELAQAFVARKKELKRTMLFLAFSGEELGLLGSAHFVKNPTIPLERVVAMLNMDMIGRLNDGALTIFGTGTSPGFEALINKYNADSTFALKLNKDGFGPSDHSSFYGKKIPVFHFFTGTHADYHKPSDDSERINAEGMEQVVRFIEKIALDLNTTVQRPVYAQVEAPRPTGQMRGFNVYVGTVPDYSDQSEGMKISSVREGSPAAKGGILGGDVMIKFGKVDIKNVYDYTYALGEYKPGEEIDVVVKRGSETKTLKIKLERRN